MLSAVQSEAGWIGTWSGQVKTTNGSLPVPIQVSARNFENGGGKFELPAAVRLDRHE